MPMKTAGKKLLAPLLGILAALAVLACLPALHTPGEVFVSVRHGGHTCLPMKDSFALLSGTGLAVYSDGGELLFEQTLPLEPEKSAASDELLAVCAGEQVLLYTPEGPAGTIPAEGEVLALAVRDGSVAVSRSGDFYPCTVTFYARTEPLYMRCLAAGDCTGILLGAGSACLMLPGELVFLSGPQETDRVPLDGVRMLYPAGDGLCAVTDETLEFFTWTGRHTGSYSEAFGPVQSFGGSVCVGTGTGAVLLDSDGTVRAAYTGSRPLAFGTGENPVLIMGEKTSVFNKKMELLYTIENKYIPLNVITEKDAAITLWPLAAEIHRK